ncbi:hypothetical protein [Mucilaginibacter polytrichastri]|uniref:HMA domain-containing protein n=1 Tax=Mucilaginibacter polytrichastri TaxID=1302689 RepID=A0A1Q6A2N1_9SPHI|nr:hypothetical protein [Mucilaginibacter polytrichastri]OKS88269.1 hypothetical protein RG47T_3735 [Mucilaginibacter polytrichastri]SFT13246.1 hypothetical protein SAMN04487890_1127 [Mucilaginibacter polytrichastri]
MDILVFKTSVTQAQQVSKVKTLLTSIPAVIKWNFDLDDPDNILRVIADQLSPRQVESVLQTAGFSCQELDD